MRYYTAHARGSATTGVLSPGSEAVLIKEGFSWPAFLLAPLWALWHRLWLVAAGFLAGAIALDLVAELFAAGPLEGAVLGLGYQAVVGVFANDLRRWTLARRGCREIGPVAAADRGAAEHRFFEQTSDAAGAPGPAAP